MKNLAYLLICAGFLFGSYVAVESVEGVPVTPFAIALAVGAIGIGLLRATQHQESRDENRVASNLDSLSTALDELVNESETLEGECEGMDVGDIRQVIDQRFPKHLDSFVQARQSLAVRHGLQAYADVMNPFAAGERYINRAWSASTDGYRGEAQTHITKALQQFQEARTALRDAAR